VFLTKTKPVPRDTNQNEPVSGETGCPQTGFSRTGFVWEISMPIEVTMGRPKKAQKTKPLRVPAQALLKLRQLALYNDLDASDYFAKKFGPVIDKEHDRDAPGG
jgi:hypothetical protein